MEHFSVSGSSGIILSDDSQFVNAAKVGHDLRRSIELYDTGCELSFLASSTSSPSCPTCLIFAYTNQQELRHHLIVKAGSKMLDSSDGGNHLTCGLTEGAATVFFGYANRYFIRASKAFCAIRFKGKPGGDVRPLFLQYQIIKI
uniref:Uncharacterized protein n=1 Tax=Quercus lobata TaxID=97700 RepID=A0A7N2N0D9_QUELO